MRKVSEYRVFSDPDFPVFSPNTGKYGPEKTPHLDNFHGVVLDGYGLLYQKFISRLWKLCNEEIK